MEVEEEGQSKNKLDEQRRNLQMQMRDIDKLTFMEPAVGEAQTQRSLCDCCKKSKGKGQTFCLSTRKYRRCHRICKACRTRKSITSRSLVQVKKKCRKIDEDMERMRARFHALSEKSGESRRAASGVEEEIRILQAREEGEEVVRRSQTDVALIQPS